MEIDMPWWVLFVIVFFFVASLSVTLWYLVPAAVLYARQKIEEGTWTS